MPLSGFKHIWSVPDVASPVLHPSAYLKKHRHQSINDRSPQTTTQQDILILLPTFGGGLWPTVVNEHACVSGSEEIPFFLHPRHIEHRDGWELRMWPPKASHLKRSFPCTSPDMAIAISRESTFQWKDTIHSVSTFCRSPWPTQACSHWCSHPRGCWKPPYPTCHSVRSQSLTVRVPVIPHFCFGIFLNMMQEMEVS